MQLASGWPALNWQMKTQMTDYGLPGWEIDPLKSDFQLSPRTAKIQDLGNSGRKTKKVV